MAIAFQKNLNGFQIVGHTPQNLFFFQPVGHRDLNGSVKRKFTFMNSLQCLERGLDHIIAFEQFGTKAATCIFNSLGERDLFMPRQQWDLAHLRQVHPYRVIRPRLNVVDTRENLVSFGLQISFCVILRIDDIDAIVTLI